ncbi:MAG: Transcriptional regulator, IclR family [uncultured Rubrobacteraceae bacterium]|uniref:Transcriptional regulator, IclR family n=1 Tax=uncultured Rubrobacteraceae bacterium TaxID=349277 RepID=A0A6J4R2V2_9ACTN|nr:MAG: Transcriptional regulator, IclR family [uncultured Rubrobacteraceae bacterium]
MRESHSGVDSGSFLKYEAQTGSKFKSVRRVFRILDLVGQRGEELTAKELARKIGTNLSSCYYLLNILTDEGYIERIPRCGGYRLGPAITALNERRHGSDIGSVVEPVLEELARRSRKHAYFGVLSDGEVAIVCVKSPPKSPPAGVAEGFRGASHALALGKVLLAGMGSEYVEEYIEDHGLEAFTPRTIVQPALLHAQLNKVRMVGLALDFEEFAQNLCSMAAPIEREVGRVEGAIGLSTTARSIREAGQQHLVELVQWAAGEASALLKEGPQNRCVTSAGSKKSV